MKKYVKPATRVIVIETQKMIAESVAISSTKVSASSAESRNSSWDDED